MATSGQPTSYKPEYNELAHNYCLLGATNEMLGDLFGVTGRTIDNWIATRNRQRQYWQAKTEAAPEIANDDLAALDAAGGSMCHVGD
jgi:hypothetical protein